MSAKPELNLTAQSEKESSIQSVSCWYVLGLLTLAYVISMIDRFVLNLLLWPQNSKRLKCSASLPERRSTCHRNRVHLPTGMPFSFPAELHSDETGFITCPK